MLRLDLLGLNLLFPQRIMVAGTIKIDNVIDILKDWLSRSQSFFTNSLELRVAVIAFPCDLFGDHVLSTRRCFA